MLCINSSAGIWSKISGNCCQILAYGKTHSGMVADPRRAGTKRLSLLLLVLA